MTEILEKNLFYIKKYNPSLCEKVLSIVDFTKNLEINTNLVGEYNLLINGMAVHSLSGAVEEARAVFKNLAHDTKNSVHVIYGLGLGYVPDEFSQNAKGSIIIFEDDLEVLRLVLEVVDLSTVLCKDNVFIASDSAEFQDAFESVFRYRSKVTCSALDYHAFQKTAQYKAFLRELERLFGLFDHNYAFQVNTIYSFLQNTLVYLDKRLHVPLLTDYKDLLKDKPAIIVSAGPSLAQNIDVLKKYKDNAYIFCVGTATKALLKNGIVPDFLNLIEKNNTTISYEVPENVQMTLISEAYTNFRIYKSKFKRRFITASEETDAARWFLDVAGKELVNFETKGTVSYHALSCAKYLGCNPIILIGQDLAYSDGNCYAKGSAFEDLECFFDEKLQKYRIYPRNFEKYRDAYYNTPKLTAEQKTELLNAAIEKFNSELVTVDGQNGEKLPTSAAYALFIDYISDFGLRFNRDVKLINSSLGGAMINGFEIMGLDVALEKYATASIDKESVFENKNFSSDVDFEKAIEKLQSELNSINRIAPMFLKGCEYVKNLNKELELHKKYTGSAAKYLQKAADLYVELTNKYTNHSKLLRMITLKEHSEIAFLMKINQMGSNLGFEDSKVFANAFCEYFENVSKNFLWVKKWLIYTIDNLKSEINENSNTKSN